MNKPTRMIDIHWIEHKKHDLGKQIKVGLLCFAN